MNRHAWNGSLIDFDRKHIDLPAAITKDGERRIVDMSDNLLEWLLLCLQAVREDSTGELPQEALGAVPRHELERRLAGRHFETFLWLLPSR